MATSLVGRCFRVILPVVASVLCAAALADNESQSGISRIMTKEDVQNELYGVWLEGETGLTKQPWSECIEPDGATRYHIDGYELIGRFRVENDGQACFSYKKDDYKRSSCFRVSKSEAGYTFWGGVEGVFTTTNVRRGIKTCPSRNAPIS